MDAANFAPRLKELREQAGLTQQALAEKAGMNRFGVAQLEQGRNKPSWDTVVALCKALGVSCDAFLQPPSEEAPRARGRPRKAPPVAPGELSADKTAHRPAKTGKGKRKGS
jgi:transcriptional regulator with XRE-family HTH domain